MKLNPLWEMAVFLAIWVWYFMAPIPGSYMPSIALFLAGMNLGRWINRDKGCPYCKEQGEIQKRLQQKHYDFSPGPKMLAFMGPYWEAERQTARDMEARLDHILFDERGVPGIKEEK